MSNLAEVAPNYNRAKSRWPDASTLSSCYDSLCACYDGTMHGMVDHVKSFIETVCLTIMGEFNESVEESSPTTTQLLRAALRSLGIENSRGASKLDKVLSGFNKLTEALVEMRNDNGPVAHGKDGFLDAISSDHARAFLHVGDAILSVLLNSLEGKEPNPLFTREPYERFTRINNKIDKIVGVDARIEDEVLIYSVTAGSREEAFEIRVEPSRLLYGVDRSAYVEILNAVGRDTLSEEEPIQQTEHVITLPEWIPTTTPPIEIREPTYSGRLLELRGNVQKFLVEEGIIQHSNLQSNSELIDFLLIIIEENTGIDWEQRSPLQASLKVACKRLLIKFGTSSNEASRVSEKFIEWLKANL